LTGIQQDTFRSLAKLETLNLKGNQILAAWIQRVTFKFEDFISVKLFLKIDANII
jgi:hypothetical protein